MSKVEELRVKYSKITEVTFRKLVEADETPTKKYLEYLLKMWDNRRLNAVPPTSQSLIDVVKKFDTLLPYIENKDIYSSIYHNFRNLRNVVENAEEKRDEKTFQKEDHAIFYKETDNYIMLQPKTHRGSMKYGAGTRWCTAGRTNASLFKTYTDTGLLVYVIKKVPTSNSNYNKIALYMKYGEDALGGHIEVFMANDSQTRPGTLINNGWDELDVFEIMTMYRRVFLTTKKDKKIRENIESFIKTLNGIKFETLINNLSKLEYTIDDSYISNIKNNLDTFLNELQSATNAIRKAQN